MFEIIKLHIEVQGIKLYGNPAHIPELAVIRLTINGMPATFYPAVMPGDDGRLRLYSDHPDDVQAAWGEEEDAWDTEVLPALKEHMHAQWDAAEAAQITAGVSAAVARVSNDGLRQLDWRTLIEQQRGLHTATQEARQ